MSRDGGWCLITISCKLIFMKILKYEESNLIYQKKLRFLFITFSGLKKNRTKIDK